MKLIIDIDEKKWQSVKDGTWCGSAEILNGTPLDNNSERAEVQAYFDGQDFGWERGRADLIEKIKAEINKALAEEGNTDTAKAQAIALSWVLQILDRIGKENE